jgi:hypothetical protein
MSEQFRLDGFALRAVFTSREVNYEVMGSDGYVCRLVPGNGSFELSKLDRGLGLEIADKTIHVITDHILNRDA